MWKKVVKVEADNVKHEIYLRNILNKKNYYIWSDLTVDIRLTIQFATIWHGVCLRSGKKNELS